MHQYYVYNPLQVVNLISGYGLSWQASFGAIAVLYFYSHYLFASGAAHIGAMYTAFLSVAMACGTPGGAHYIYISFTHILLLNEYHSKAATILLTCTTLRIAVGRVGRTTLLHSLLSNVHASGEKLCIACCAQIAAQRCREMPAKLTAAKF